MTHTPPEKISASKAVYRQWQELRRSHPEALQPAPPTIPKRLANLIELQNEVRDSIDVPNAVYSGDNPGLLPHEPFLRSHAGYDPGLKSSIQDIRRPLDPIESTHRHAHYLTMKAAAEAEAERESARLEEEELRNQELELDAIKKHAVRAAFLHTLRVHEQDFVEFFAKRAKAVKTICAQVLQYISSSERKKRMFEDRERRLRMKALKDMDMEAYSKLVTNHKNDRLSMLLSKSEEYLVQVGVKMNETSTDGGTFSGQELEVVSEQPAMLSFGKLKEYQIQGLEWLVNLYNNNLNGILADEMGLGKTIQTISLLCHLMEKKGDHGPFLIVVPLSTLSNWEAELTRWAPTLAKVVYCGNPTERKALYERYMQTQKFNVLVTTYEYILSKSDRKRLEKVDWHYIIVDEGHRMKNKASKFSIALRSRYRSKHRLILTGTPLQNNLAELWSLLNFLLPKVFNSSDNFEAWFNKPLESAGVADSAEIEEEEKLVIINRLHQVLRPFLLRRLKVDVAKEMPDKVEIVVKCQLSAWQHEFYKQIQETGVLRNNGRSGYTGLNNTFMQLRKICNHPYLFLEAEELNSAKVSQDIVRSSGKFELLDRMLPKLHASGHRVLLFSQMTKALDIMEDYLEYKRYRYLRLDGSTKQSERGDMLKQFNADSSPFFIFLLSTRAGGLGLNLQVADTVVIFDSDWNPQMDLQAQDRAHRIGQTNEVRVFRLITLSPIEEQILEKAYSKLGLDNMVIQAGRFNKSSTDSERKQLLESVIRQGVDSGSQVRVPDGEELNRMLARDDDEFELFETMDIERKEKELADWRELGNSGPVPPRLMTYDEIPDRFKNPLQDSSESESDVEFTLLGKRKRKASTGMQSYAEDELMTSLTSEDEDEEPDEE